MKKKVKEISTKEVKNNPKKNRKKTKKIMGRAEFLFNVISLLILIYLSVKSKIIMFFFPIVFSESYELMKIIP